jgi:uncharacterized protein YegP (UPF0339 family)
MATSVDFYVDGSDEHRWRVKATNGQIIGAATEGYRRQEHASNNLTSIGRIATPNNIRIAHDYAESRPDDALMPVEFYKDNADEWRWRITARNGNIVHASSEGYTTKLSARANIEALVSATEEWLNS